MVIIQAAVAVVSQPRFPLLEVSDRATLIQICPARCHKEVVDAVPVHVSTGK